MPEMVGNQVAIYNGKVFTNIEVKFDMIGRYLGEFSLTYKRTRPGKAGIGATKGSAHTALKWMRFDSLVGFEFYHFSYPNLPLTDIDFKIFHKINWDSEMLLYRIIFNNKLNLFHVKKVLCTILQSRIICASDL